MKILILGGGTSGIFCALTLINNGYDGSKITILDKGKMIDKRICFVNSETNCKKCKICSIVNGIGGSGSYSDSKLNFDTSGRIGGNMYELMTQKEITEYLEKTYNIYKQFGIDNFKSSVYGLNITNEAQQIINKIHDNPNLDIGECATLHLGSENSRIIYKDMVDFLIKNNVHIISNTEVLTIDSDKKEIHTTKDKYTYDQLIIAMGRSGNKLIKDICDTNDIHYKTGAIDIGVRVECLDDIMRQLNENFYECKIYFEGSFGDKSRMFCTNPSGFVTIENYKHNNTQLFTANGHAYRNKKSNNTNFAILVTRNFNEDCSNPLENYAYPMIQSINSLGKGSVILQSLDDILSNRRSTEERIASLDIIPTANVYKGDITSAMPYRTLTTILEFLKELDEIAPGIYGKNTLLYSPEAKFHANKVIIDKHGKTSQEDIYCIGDCSGWCRGLTTACSMGILCAEKILNK